MPFVPVANTAEAELRYLMDGQQIENTLYFELPSAIAPADLLSLGGDLIAWWGDNYAPQSSTSLQLVEVACTDLTTSTSAVVSSTPAVAAFGEVSSGFLPMNDSLAVSFRTNQRGRSFRGRNYFAGLCESQVDGNDVSLVTADAIKAAYEQLLPAGGIFTSDWVWVVVSRFSGVDTDHKPIPRVAGVTTTVTSVVSVDRTIDSMRRRLPGRGR